MRWKRERTGSSKIDTLSTGSRFSTSSSNIWPFIFLYIWEKLQFSSV